MNKYAGRERLKNIKVWQPGKVVDGKRIKGHYRQVNASSLGMEVADILGQVWRGLYHLEEDKINWEDEKVIEVNIVEPLSTWDFSRLTELVVLCHDRSIRMLVRGCNPIYPLKLAFSKRKRSGEIYERHPKLEEAIESIRSSIGLGIVD